MDNKDLSQLLLERDKLIRDYTILDQNIDCLLHSFKNFKSEFSQECQLNSDDASELSSTVLRSKYLFKIKDDIESNTTEIIELFYSKDEVQSQKPQKTLKARTARLTKHCQLNWDLHIKDTETPTWPNFNLKYFVKAMMKEYPSCTDEELVQNVIQLNNSIRDQYKQQDPIKYKLAIEKQGFFLRNKYLDKDDFVVKMSAALRDSLWERDWPGVSIGKCFCCKKELKRGAFHAGHIIASAKGGQTILSNLKPICSLCNTSMGAKDLMEFAKQFC